MHEPLAAEIDSFLGVVRNGDRPKVDGKTGCGPSRSRMPAPGRRDALAGTWRPVDQCRPRDDRPVPPNPPNPPIRSPTSRGTDPTVTTSPLPPRHDARGRIGLPRTRAGTVSRPVAPWIGGRAPPAGCAVVGAGKMGLPLAAQFASHGWHVTAVDVQGGRRRGDQRGPVARRARSRASPSRRGPPTRPAASARRRTARRRPATATSSC